MAGKAIYMGPRLKRLRRDLGLTQANMAADLEISPSYIALLERNQRPVTADLLLRLAQTYPIDLSTLSDSGQDEWAARLQGILKEPFFADLDLPALDIADIATNYPGFAEAMLRLHTAYAEEQLALAERQSLPPGSAEMPSAASDPVGEVRHFLAARRNCFAVLDDHAGQLAGEIGGAAGMVRRLEDHHGLSVRFVGSDITQGALRWHDIHRKRLYISQLLDHPARNFQLALQLAHMEAGGAIASALGAGRFNSANGHSMAARALAAYWAAALLMPYRAFARAARAQRHDIEALSRQFQTSFEQVAHRLTTLQKPGEEGVPFFFLRIDRAGNVSKRLDGAGFPFARHGGACPLWNIHAAFEAPGSIVTQRLELPDGQRFISIARTVSAGGGSFQAPVARRVVALACAEEHAGLLVYHDQLAQSEPAPIGVACHLCHRPHCIARSAPPLGREMHPDTNLETGIPFAFADR